MFIKLFVVCPDDSKVSDTNKNADILYSVKDGTNLSVKIKNITGIKTFFLYF